MTAGALTHEKYGTFPPRPILGAQVFRPLLRLPLPYFELRPTGTLVARLHGVETIREFVSSAAATLILDFPLLLVILKSLARSRVEGLQRASNGCFRQDVAGKAVEWRLQAGASNSSGFREVA